MTFYPNAMVAELVELGRAAWLDMAQPPDLSELLCELDEPQAKRLLHSMTLLAGILAEHVSQETRDTAYQVWRTYREREATNA